MREMLHALQAMVRRLAASRPGSWMLSRSLAAVDPVILKMTRGKATLTSMLAGVPVVMVTTRGARSGRPRTVPLLPVHDPGNPGRFALIASNWGQRRAPMWYFNLRAYPRAECELEGRSETYTAHEAQGEEYERFWSLAVGVYGGYALYKERAGRRIPIMVMESGEFSIADSR